MAHTIFLPVKQKVKCEKAGDIDFSEQCSYFRDDRRDQCAVSLQENADPMTENLLDRCWNEIMWLQKNIKNPKNGRTPFSNAVLLFNAIKNLRRFEKGKDDFSYTPSVCNGRY